jgi:hypothetical protein
MLLAATSKRLYYGDACRQWARRHLGMRRYSGVTTLETSVAHRGAKCLFAMVEEWAFSSVMSTRNLLISGRKLAQLGGKPEAQGFDLSL